MPQFFFCGFRLIPGKKKPVGQWDRAPRNDLPLRGNGSSIHGTR